MGDTTPTESDKLKARREARRAKIMSSGNDRLSKITQTFSGVPHQPSDSPSPAGEGTPTPSVTANAAAAQTPAQPTTSTPPSSNPLQKDGLRNRFATQPAQSPSIARTPQSATTTTTFPFTFETDSTTTRSRPQRTATPTPPDDIFASDALAELDPTGLGEFDPSLLFGDPNAGGLQGLPPALKAAAAAAAAANAGAARPQETEKVAEPLPLRIWQLFHTLAVLALALFAVYMVAESVEELEGVEGYLSDVDAEGLGYTGWRLLARRVALLKHRPVEDIGVLHLRGMDVVS
ncbi:hypothetical protein HDV00_008165 [Rhizophlyctis rosea]|nr:hypothetical protein HDV00_008165 [Rhizophlyctis rosea]